MSDLLALKAGKGGWQVFDGNFLQAQQQSVLLLRKVSLHTGD